MSEIKVNKISPRTACGTVTLGDSGDTFTIPAGATITNSGTASGFGATGSASWDTTVKTGDFTATAGIGYFVNTTSGEVDVTLPAGTAGAVIAVADYANNFSTANCILKQNGSEKIEGSTDDYVVNVEGAAITLVYVDGTKGWIVTDTGNSDDANAAEFICATGGTITNTPTCRIHTFTGPGTFTVNKVSATTPARNDVSYIVVAGGGSGGARNPGNANGGGGGGGFREDKSPLTPYTASPLDGAPLITIAAGSYPITVGGGGTGVTQQASPELQGNDGSVSTFDSVTSAGGGGGGGGGNNVPLTNGRPGGSGGGSGGGIPSGVSGGTGNTPPVSPAQGTNGGIGGNQPSNGGGAGGGGATEVGENQASSPTSGRGGAGATTNISNSPVGYSGGGGGSGGGSITAGAASPCGSGAAGGSTPTGSDAAVNRGGGGGGGGVAGGAVGTSGAGGSGVVIIRYKIA